MDMADHCATLPNERINPRFGRATRAIESSESRKIAPLINRPAAALNPPHGSIIRQPENMRPRASKFWPSAQVTRHATGVPLSRAHLTGLSILTIKDSSSQALNHAHLWILWTIKHTVTYRTCTTRCIRSGRVSIDLENTHTGWRCRTFRSAGREGPPCGGHPARPR